MTTSNSRICIKNIPKHVSEEDVRKHFQKNGAVVTDVRVLKSAKTGEARRMAFVGFKTTKEAEDSVKFFNKTFFDTSKLMVEIAKPYGDPDLEAKKKRLKKTDDKPSLKRGKPEKEEQVLSEKHKEFLNLMRPNKRLRPEDLWNEKEEEESSGSENDEKDEDLMEKTEEKEEKTIKSVDPTRLFVRNLTFACTKEDLIDYLTTNCEVNVLDVTLPLDESQRPKGFGVIQLSNEDETKRVLKKLDGKIFQGRLLHILPAKKTDEEEGGAGNEKKKLFKQEREDERRLGASSEKDKRAWNALFVRGDAAVGAIAASMNTTKRHVLGMETDGDDAAVRVAQSEARVVEEAKEMMRSEGIDLNALEKALVSKSKTNEVTRSDVVIIVKNLPHDSVESDVKSLFSKHGNVTKFVMPPSKTLALVAFADPAAAKKAFSNIAYTRYRRVPIYLEWAPQDVLIASRRKEEKVQEEEEEEEEDVSKVRILFVKNLDFQVRTEDLKKHTVKVLGYSPQSVNVSMRKGKNGEDLSAGYGFIQFQDNFEARKALKKLLGTELEGRSLDVQLSTTAATTLVPTASAKSESNKTKIMVRNLAFQVTKKEIRKLFETYGTLKSVRLPKSHSGEFRGFAFVDFSTNKEAKAAMNGLSAAHLYGRHLVMEFASHDDDNGLDGEEN